MTRQVTQNQLVYEDQDYDYEPYIEEEEDEHYEPYIEEDEHHYEQPYVEEEHHPVVVVDSEPHSSVSYDGDTIVVTDDHSSATDELLKTEKSLVRGLGELTAWLGSHFGFIPSHSNGGQRYYDSRHDLDMARAANKFL